MKKSDLKVGYVIQSIDDSFAMVIQFYNKFLDKFELKFVRQNSDRWMSIDSYHDNLQQISSTSPELAIKRIYGCPNDIRYTFTCSSESRELLWSHDERETAVKMTVEEIENALGHKIEIVSNK